VANERKKQDRNSRVRQHVRHVIREQQAETKGHNTRSQRVGKTNTMNDRKKRPRKRVECSLWSGGDHPEGEKKEKVVAAHPFDQCNGRKPVRGFASSRGSP